MTHSRSPGARCRSRCIDGSATFTMVTSVCIMNVATHMASSVSRRCWAVCTVSPWLIRVGEQFLERADVHVTGVEGASVLPGGLDGQLVDVLGADAESRQACRVTGQRPQ